MSVRIRLTGTDPAELDAVEAAIRTVLDMAVGAIVSRDYPSHSPDDPTVRRYLEVTNRPAKRGAR